jgi:hypothetical protein
MSYWFQILCALLNCSRPKLRINLNEEYNLAKRMNEKRTSSNTLKDYVTSDEMKSKSEKVWLSIDARVTIIDFPQLTIETMIEITLVIY